MGSVILRRGHLLLKHVGLPHRRFFSTLHLTGSALPHRGVILIENVGLAQQAFSEGVPRGVESLDVIETPTRDFTMRRRLSLSLSLSLSLAHEKNLCLFTSRASRRRLRLRAIRIRVRRVSKHFGALLSLGIVDPLWASSPLIACAIQCGLPEILKLTVSIQTAELERVFLGAGDRFRSGCRTQAQE